MCKTKNYDQYGENAKIPFCYIDTNHIPKGNSGIPAINSKGNLTGLNFDRVCEGTMSDLYYDPIISRNSTVDVRHIVIIIDNYAGA